MGQIKLNSSVSSFPSSSLQATPAKTTLPPASLNKQLSHPECPSPQDQNNLKQLSEGNSKTKFSFLDDSHQPDLPSAKEFFKLLQEVGESNKLRPKDAPAGPGHHRQLDQNITQGKEQLEKIRQAAAQDPSSPEAVKMLWLLEEHNKVGQGYEHLFRDHAMAYGNALTEAIKDAGITPAKPKAGMLSNEEAQALKAKILQQREKQAIDSIHEMLSP